MRARMTSIIENDVERTEFCSHFSQERNVLLTTEADVNAS